MLPTNNPFYRRQQLLIEFANLQQTSPPGIYLTLSPTSPTKIWHGVFFPRRGPYAGAILRFDITFTPPPEVHLQTRVVQPPPEVHLQTHVFHPLVHPNNGRLHLTALGREPISDLLEGIKGAFEKEEVLDALAEAQVVNREAWESWNERRERRGGWNEKVESIVAASHEQARTRTAQEVVLLKGELGDDAQSEAADAIKLGIQEVLRERGVRVREY